MEDQESGQTNPQIEIAPPPSTLRNVFQELLKLMNCDHMLMGYAWFYFHFYTIHAISSI